MAGEGRERREGVRMGLWGAAQAVAFGFGGFAGAAASDLARALIGSPAAAYGTVFALEALLFVAAALLALRIEQPHAAAEHAAPAQRPPLPTQAGTPVVAAEMR
jgi:BCD family chlorophyll transporter-like MFS transporter